MLNYFCNNKPSSTSTMSLIKYIKLLPTPVFFSIFFITTFLLPSCNAPKVVTAPSGNEQAYEIHFEQSEMLMPVLEKAKQEGKMVFVDFYADWCLPCKLMEEDVFTDPEIGKLFNENFLNMHVDGESGAGSNLVSIFEVKVYPTLLFLDADGKVIVRKEGAAFHSELRDLANQAIKGGNPN